MLAQLLANYAISLDYSTIPGLAIQQAKRSILDALGVAIAGSLSHIGKSIVSYVSVMGGPLESTVITTQLKCPAPNAALAIGTMGHALDYDDESISLAGHPTVTILPAALTLGEKTKASGKEILTAFITGLEIVCKIGKVVNPDHFNKGFHPTSTLGVFGATIAAAKILRLSSDEVANAIGIAGSMSPGLQENFGSFTKPLHAGLASQNGVVSTLLAKGGITSSRSILEGERGFFKAFVDKKIEPIKILERLGNPFELVDQEIIYKLYPTCSRTQAAISGILDLMKRHRFSKDLIDIVDCGTDEKALDILIFHKPKTIDQCRFSMEFCIALAILNKGVRLCDFCEKQLNDPKVLEMMNKIKMSVDPEIVSLGYNKRSAVSITVKLIDGKEYRNVNFAKGFAENPISDNDIIGKYRDCAGPLLKKENLERSIELILNLEKVDDVSQLTQLLVSNSDILK